MFDRILVAVDPEHANECEAAMRAALDQKREDADLMLLGVVDSEGTAFFPHVPETSPEAAETALREKLDILLRKHFAPNVPARILTAHGAPARAIVETAQTENADLIVLTSHGEGGRWPRPRHTVEYVAVNAPCAVLVLRGMLSRPTADRGPG